jgi:hypothetical protein
MEKRHLDEDEKAAKEDEAKIKKQKTIFANEKTELDKLKKANTDADQSGFTSDEK